MSRNLGTTSLRRRPRTGNPMRSFDDLPPPLRQWLTQAVLPWSPASARRVWSRAMARGLTTDGALDLLSRVEAKTLARDRHANLNGIPTDV